jgi:hypothetical protein
MSDPLSASRGILVALLLSALVWIVTLVIAAGWLIP